MDRFGLTPQVRADLVGPAHAASMDAGRPSHMGLGAYGSEGRGSNPFGRAPSGAHS